MPIPRTRKLTKAIIPERRTDASSQCERGIARSLRPAIIFCFLAAFFSCTWSSRVPESSAAGEWVESCWQEVAHPSRDFADKTLYPPAQFLQHSFIWDAFAPDDLARPSESAVLEAYQLSNWAPFFIDNHFAPSPAARELMARLQTIERDAIDPAPYRLKQVEESTKKLEEACTSLNSLEPLFRTVAAKMTPAGAALSATDFVASCRTAAESDPSSEKLIIGLQKGYKALFDAAAAFDIQCTRNLIRLSTDLDPFSKDDQTKFFSGQMTMSELLKAVEPSSPRYLAIRKAYNHYRSLPPRDKRATLPATGSLRLGDSGKTVAQLQERLKEEGLYEGGVTGTFDAATEAAIKEFQKIHMSEPDGVVGPQSKYWLNASFQTRTLLLGRSLKLLRQSASRLYTHYIRINVPEFMLEYYKDGKRTAVHRVIVGKAAGKKIKIGGQEMSENSTPPITSKVERLIFNPRWYVSDRIRKEFDVAISNDPGFFSRNGYVQMSSTYASGAPRIFQLPGPKNPLGRIKFEFDNAYAIFIHDTPNKSLFQRSRRDFSHGCVRVDKALELARTVLEDDGNPYANKIDDILNRNNQVYVELNEPLPIVIEYIPVTTNEKGNLVFCGDPYGWFDAEPKK